MSGALVLWMSEQRKVMCGTLKNVMVRQNQFLK